MACKASNLNRDGVHCESERIHSQTCSANRYSARLSTALAPTRDTTQHPNKHAGTVHKCACVQCPKKCSLNQPPSASPAPSSELTGPGRSPCTPVSEPLAPGRRGTSSCWPAPLPEARPANWRKQGPARHCQRSGRGGPNNPERHRQEVFDRHRAVPTSACSIFQVSLCCSHIGVFNLSRGTFCVSSHIGGFNLSNGAFNLSSGAFRVSP